MRAAGIEMGVTVGGTGNITLTPLVGKVAYSSVFGGTGSKIVEYVINDNGSMETGVGSLNLSTNVLTRSRINTTWDGTTWDDTNPSALNVSTTASVTCGDVGYNHLPALTVGMIKTITNGDDAGTLPLNWSLTTGVSGTLIAGRLMYIPIHWGCGGEIDQMTYRVTTTHASNFISVALYDVGTDGLPNRLIKVFGEGSTGTGGMVKIGSGSFGAFFLPPGWYYLAMISTSSTVVLRAASITYSGPAGVQSGQSIPYIYRVTTYTAGAGVFAFPTTESNALTAVTGTLIAPMASLRLR